MAQTALILGASGKIGRHFTAAFHAAGWQTRAYKRGTDMSTAAQGCDVIVNGMNPPNYHDWEGILPALTRDVITAAKASGATILFPGNVYVYGAQPGPWSEDTPHAPCSRKGEIRSQIEGMYRDAAAEGVQTILLRAGDFLAPEVGDSHVDMTYLRGFAKGEITTMGDPKIKRAHAWLPDMARAAVMLAEKRADLPAFTDIPLAGLTFSTEDLAREITRQAGKPLKIARMPWWLFTLAAPVWEMARELREMRYLYNTPHRLSGGRLSQILPDFTPTSFEQVIAEILAARSMTALAA
ncbi:NAD-dependent epimerase/dehydratase family protein [Pararhodobacter oceanensis]|uniref:NAD-dependent epimerase/dehydratase family protein n=1 Tax=Pararhodobacter oceanensis TaxID=2172121 RepID=UPI003A943147